MQEVWKFRDHTVYLICEYVNKGNFAFTVKPADLDSAEAAKALTKLSLHLANQKVWQSSDDRLRY